MYLRDFEWNVENKSHIWRHGVDILEAQEVFINRPVYQRTRNGRYIALGISSDGRYLLVVFYLKMRGLIRVITARDMTTREKHRFRNRIKG